MATLKRESSLGKGKEREKEKRGTSPSNSSITHAQRKPSTASTEKQVPNYLKPTKSSRNDAAAAAASAIKNLIKKPAPEDTSQTPNLLRRRSFDRPPSAARAHKALISPVRHKPSAAPVRDKATTSRSASFSSKSTSAPKATLERVALAKKSNAAKPHTLSSSRSIKKTPSPIPTTKRGVGTGATYSASKRAPSSHDKKEAQNPETKHENKESLDHHLLEEVVQDEQGEIDDIEIPIADESENTDVVDTTEVESVEKEQHTTDISSTFAQEHDVPQSEKGEDKVHEGKSDHTQHGEDKENHSKEEIIVGDDNQEKISHEEPKTETEDGGEEHATEEVALAATKEIEEEKQPERRLEDDEDEHEHEHEHEGNQQGLESSKEEMVEGEVEELEAEAEAANLVAQSQAQVGHGKKESATPYNDVIEETANKLLEERKNKVRALVGAFETVIDKETSNAK